MVLGIINSGIFIDILTLLASPFISKKRGMTYGEQYDLSIIVPAYNEEQNITQTIEHAFNQTKQPKQVIVIDDNSKDRTYKICKELQKKYKNLKLIRQKQNKGKAYNVTYVLNRFKISNLTMVLDADTFLSSTFVEEMTKPFINDRIAIVTGKSFPVKHQNFFGKIIYHGSIFQYKFFAFRKHAQSIRNAVSVISGDSSIYRTSFLREVGGLPQGTQTEDMDITWIALEMGHKVYFQGKAIAHSKDAETFIGHWKQITRWYAGGVQCFYRHGRSLWKAKPLFLTTLLPFYIDSLLFGTVFLFSWIFIFKYPAFVIGFYTADLLFTIIALIFVDPKGIYRLPQIYIIKFIWAVAWLWAVFKTTIQFLSGQREWGGTWSRDSFYKKKTQK